MRVSGPIICFVALAGVFPANAQSFNVVTVAGADSVRDGSQAKTAALRAPRGVATDAAGNVYIADAKANRVRKVTPAGIISTVAGTGVSGAGGDGGPAKEASLDNPFAVALDSAGNLYIADNGNNRIRKVSAATGIITTFAGNGAYRAAGDGGPATAAAFDPYHIAIDASGNVYIADNLNNRIRKITAATGIISTIAGTGMAGYGGDAANATSALMDGPAAVALDTAGNIYICDQFNSVIRKIGTDGIMSTVAGTGGYGDGGDNGPATRATLLFPDTIAVDAARSKLYISVLDRIRVVDLGSGTIGRFAGTGDIGFSGDGGVADRAMFYLPMGLSVAANGDLLVADMGNYRVRRISGGGVDTVAGTDVRDGGSATQAFLAGPEGVALAANGDLFITDTGNARVRKVTAGDGKIATIAGTGQAGYLSGRIQMPSGIALDPNGNIAFADYGNNRIQRISPQGTMSTIAGSDRASAGFAGDGGFPTSALLNGPADVAYDAAGNLFIADMGNFRVRKVDAVTGLITTVAGTGQPGGSGLNGPATRANITPSGLAVDAGGNLYIADLGSRVLKVSAGSGLISMIAGTGSPGFSGDGKPATAAQVHAPTSVAVDAAGNIYIADFGNSAIRKVTAAGVISTIAGSGRSFLDNETGPALACGMMPFYVRVSPSGEVYFADSTNDRIRKLVPVTVRSVAVSAGNNQSGKQGDKLTISVKAVDDSGNGVAGVAVVFTLTSGSATLSPATVLTGVNGVASTTVTLGDKTGSVVITASASGFPAVTFNLTVTAAPVIEPPASINAGGVVGAGLTPGKRALAAGGIGSIFGQAFAPAGTARKVEPGDLVNGRVSTMLAGVCVEVGGVRAPVFAVYPGQINFQAPSTEPGDQVPVRVITGCGTATETRSNSESVAVRANAPEFFYFRPSTTGRAPVAAIHAITGAYLGGAELGSGFTAAQPKDVVTIFGTSFGGVDPAVAPGEFAPGIAGVTAPVKVSIDGRELPAGNVLYSGVTPNSPGLYQLNIILPEDLRDGDLSVELTIGGVTTPAGAYLTVRKQ